MNTVVVSIAVFVVCIVWLIGAIVAYKSMSNGVKSGWAMLWSAFSWLFFVVLFAAFVAITVIQRTYDMIDDLTDNIVTTIHVVADWVDEVI